MTGIEKIAWNAEAEAALLPALLEDMPEIRSQVGRGICELWQVSAPGRGYVVTRLEDYEAAPRELCIVAGAGEGYRATLPALVEIAANNGAARVRIHTHRPGVCRWLEALEFEELERVYVKKIQ